MIDHAREELSFLPPHLLGRVESPAARRGFDRLAGALLYADISGFTGMTEKLDHPDEGGGEAVTEVVNRCFALPIDIIEAHGGGILRFGGDALVAYFDEALVDAVPQAASAARGIVAAIGALPVTRIGADEFRFGVKIGLHAGRILALSFPVGPDHPEFFYAGPALAALARAESAARPGEIMATPEFLARLASARVGGHRPRPLPFTLPAASEPVGPVYRRLWENLPLAARRRFLGRHRPLLPPPIARRWARQGGDTRWVLDHRRVTSLFLNFSVAGARLRRAPVIAFVQEVNRILERFGGCYGREDLSEEGLKILAYFGTPLAHDREEEQAILAALELARLCERQPGCDWRIGMQTGLVFCGFVGNAIRREYTVMGDAVNTAARLMARARWGEILAGDETVRAAGGLFETRARRLRLKGKTAPLTAHAVRGTRQRNERPVTVVEPVGRREELRTLQELLAAPGRVVAGIRGEAGMGKSTLLAAATAWWRGKRRRLIACACQPYGQQVAYHAAGRLVAALLGVNPDEEPARAARLLRRQAADAAAGLAALVGLPVSMVGGKSAVTFESMTRALAGLLRARQDGLVVIEDLHWMDERSRELLAAVLERLAAVRLLTTARPAGAALLAGTTVLELKPFTVDETGTLMQRLLGRSAVSETDVRAIHLRSAGNPFFITEIARLLGEHGPRSRLPASLRNVLGARVDALRPDEHLLLQAASVIGAEFDAGLLERLRAGLPRAAERRHILDRLVARQFLARRSARVFTFRHALIHELVYERTARRLRHELHGDLARAGEAAGNKSASYLAYHFERGGDAERAARWYLHAGEQADRVFANERALGYYRRAAAIARKNAPALAGAGHLRSAEVLKRIGQYEEAIRDYESACRCGREAGDVPLQVEARDSIGVCCQRLGRHDSARLHSQRALERVRGFRGAPWPRRRALVAKCLNSLTVAHWYRGRYEDAIRCGRESIALRRQERDPINVARGLFSLGNSYAKIGDFREARRCFRDLIRISRRIGDRPGIAYGLDGLGYCARVQGDYATALRVHARSRRLREKTGDRRGLVYANLGVVEAQLAMGLCNRAEPGLVEAERQLGRTSELNLLSDVFRNRGHQALERNELMRAKLFLERALRAAEHTGFVEAQLRTLFLVALTLARGGRYAAAAALARRLRRAAERVRMPEHEALALVVQGDLAAATNRLSLARSRWRRARDLARAHGLAAIHFDCVGRLRYGLAVESPISRVQERLLRRMAAALPPPLRRDFLACRRISRFIRTIASP